MSDTTTILNLPFILPAQAQKHVTHNEALKRLDVVTQLSVKSRSLSAPPLAQDGDRYIVADAASGDWAGKEGWIAHMDSGAWQFIAPGTGWRCWVEDENTLLASDGTGWSGLSLGIVPELGIATSADAQNPLSVAGPGSLFTNAGSDHRLTINKAAASDTASLIFQTGYSGRAEIGLSGDDRFRVKVSGDGATFADAIEIDNSTGHVSFPNGGGGPHVAQVRNTDITTDVNTAAFTDLPLTGATDILDGPSFAVSGNGIECLRAGRVRVTVSLHIESLVTRANLNLRLAVNGVGLPGQAASGYIRAHDGHNESSLHLSRLVEVSAGDVVTAQARQEAMAGLVTLTDGNSLLLIEQW